MATFIVLVCSCACFLVTTAYYKYIYLPIKNKRAKRRVNQNIHSLPPSSSSPFVEVDSHRVNRIITTENISIVEPGHHHIHKITTDISNIPKATTISYIPKKSNKLFKPTRVII
ncbi:hypothetical protein LY90DRAFT_698178, partial [Neocallimastix californiae]